MKITDVHAGNYPVFTNKTTDVAVISTTDQYIWMPLDDWAIFTNQVKAASSDFTCTSYFPKSCYSMAHGCEYYWSALQNLTFVFNDTIFNIPPEGYTLPTGTLGYPCLLGVWSESTDYILG
jgi:hypothetical protein